MCHQTLQIRIHLTAKHRHLSIWKLQSTGHWIAQAGTRFINVLAAPVAFFRSLRPWRFLWSYSLKPIRFHPMPLRPRNGLHDLGETLPEMSRGVLGDSTKSLSSMWWNTLFDVVGLCNYSPFVARLVCRNQNGVSHDTRKQWKQHGPVQGQMWKSSAAQDSLYIYNWLLFPIPKKSAPFSPVGYPPDPGAGPLPPCGSCRRPFVQGCRAAQRSSSAAMSMGVPLGGKRSQDFHYTACFIRSFVVIHYNPHITWVGWKTPSLNNEGVFHCSIVGFISGK